MKDDGESAARADNPWPLESGGEKKKAEMNQRAQIRLLPDGRRLHLHDGPIDLIVEAFGAPAKSRRRIARVCAICDGARRIVQRASVLAAGVLGGTAVAAGAVARRMMAAVMPYAAEYFITPMAAVAGAVAEEILATMVADAQTSRAPM